jgi:hypothetical protein
LTTRIAIIGVVLSAIVFVSTVARPNPSSEWPPLLQALANAAGVFLVVWIAFPVIASLILGLASLSRRVLGPPGRR